MRRDRIVPFVLVLMLAFGGTALAQSSVPGRSLITPADGRLLYGLKIAFEDAAQTFLDLVAPDDAYRYLQARAEKRGAEMRQMEDEYAARVATEVQGGAAASPFDQKNYLVSASLAGDEWERLSSNPTATAAGGTTLLKTVPVAFIDVNGTIRRSMEDRLAKLREDLLAAKAAGDTAATDRLLAELKAAQRDYIRELDVSLPSATAAENLWSRLLTALKLGPDEQVIAAGDRAAAIKAHISALEDKLGVPAALRTNFDDLDKAIAKANEEAAKPDLRRRGFGDLMKALMDKPAESALHVKSDAEQKRLPDEKPAQAAAAPAVPAPAAQPNTVPAARNQPQTPPKPKLKPVPSDTVSRSPLALTGLPNSLSGVVGRNFEWGFGAQGGLPPYYYRLDSGVGFPPMGVILGDTGILSGTPTAAGTSVFGVCVVDTAGKSDCKTLSMTVRAPETTPAPPPVPEPAPAVDCSMYTKLPDACTTDSCSKSFVACDNAIPSDISDTEYNSRYRQCEFQKCACINDCMRTQSEGWRTCYTPRDCSVYAN